MATEVVGSVSFSFMTDEDVRKQSVIKVTNPNLLDILERPVPGGLYDPAMGPLDDFSNSKCKSCGQNALQCNGHCGHIELVNPAYNSPLFGPSDGKVSLLEHVFIRGSRVRFMVIPDMLKNAPMIKNLEAKIKGKKGSLRGVGRGNAVAARARAQAAGRGAPPGRGAVPPVRR